MTTDTVTEAVIPGTAEEDIRAGEVVELAVNHDTGQGRVRRRRVDGQPIPRWFEKPDGGVRMIPVVDDDAMVNAVLAARAVVRLDEARWKLTVERAELLAQVDAMKAEIGRLEQENRVASRAVARVRMAHQEATRHISGCSDGCCFDTEPLGTCERCGEPYPCATVRAVDGE